MCMALLSENIHTVPVTVIWMHSSDLINKVFYMYFSGNTSLRFMRNDDVQIVFIFKRYNISKF